MRRGVRLGIDVGAVRIGIAASDASGILASPVKTIHYDPEEMKDITYIMALVHEYDVLEIIVGFPKMLSGKQGSSANFTQSYAKLLACKLPTKSVRLVDERLSTVRAHSVLMDIGLKTHKHRKIIDQVAAVDILQHALDMERNTGKAPGEKVYCSGTEKDPS